MGLESDQEIIQLIGVEPDIIDLFSGSIEEPYNIGVYTQLQKNISAEAEAMEVLANVVLNHVPVENFCFRLK
eukprot:gene46598-60001_t